MQSNDETMQSADELAITRYAAREHSLSWLNSKALEYSSFYASRMEAIRSGDPAKVVAAERALDGRRRELIFAIQQELSRVETSGEAVAAMTNTGHTTETGTQSDTEELNPAFAAPVRRGPGRPRKNGVARA